MFTPLPSQIMSDDDSNLMGIREVDSLTVYANGNEIKWDEASVFGGGKLEHFCVYEEIVQALATPQLHGYLKWTPPHVPPQDTFIHDSMPKSPNHFVIEVSDVAAFFEYLKKQEHPPLNVLYSVIKDNCGGNLETLSFEVKRELIPYDTGIPVICD